MPESQFERQSQEILNRAFNPDLNALRLDVEGALRQDQWADLALTGWSSAVGGSGAVTQLPRQHRLATGATGSSSAVLGTPAIAGWSAGQAYDRINWGKRIVIALALQLSALTTNGVARVTLGKVDVSLAALGVKGIGIQFANAVLSGLAHDGTDLSTVSLGTTFTVNLVYRVVIVSDGLGNVEWFVNGVSKGTSAGGPIGVGTAGQSRLVEEATNGADAVAYTCDVHSEKVYVAQ